jgi:hypothetical protein
MTYHYIGYSVLIIKGGIIKTIGHISKNEEPLTLINAEVIA